MSSSYSYYIYSSAKKLPPAWDNLASETVFLSRRYMEVLEESCPENMKCHFIGLYENDKLIGVALSQFLDLNHLQSFGERDQCVKTSIRNFVFRNFASHVLFIGNNMLTGQNSYAFRDDCDAALALKTLLAASDELKSIFKSLGKKVHIVTFKDFPKAETALFQSADFREYYQCNTQPNMVFEINTRWKTEQDYINALTKKYRDQYKRARKKGEGIEKRKLHLDEIIMQEDLIYDLYYHVAKNAPFNTFFLAKNHFSTFKKLFGGDFLFYGYFKDEKLIGFNTMIKNGKTMDTYFLGYDESIQREKMLYLNMLYDMIAFAVNKGYEEIIFARTALEIKSSVGAIPVSMYGFLRHERKLLNRYMSKIFPYLEPETPWQQRHPFKVDVGNAVLSEEY